MYILTGIKIMIDKRTKFVKCAHTKTELESSDYEQQKVLKRSVELRVTLGWGDTTFALSSLQVIIWG